MKKERAERRPTCRYHCTSCGQHFTSLVAFDAHRTGSYSRGERRCEQPDGVRTEKGRKALQIQTSNGVCRLTGYCDEKQPVELWEAA